MLLNERRSSQLAEDFVGYSLEELQTTLETERGYLKNPGNRKYIVWTLLSNAISKVLDGANPDEVMDEMAKMVDLYTGVKERTRKRIRLLKKKIRA